MEYRLGRKEDLDAICELISGAVELMERQGIHQWDEVYPARDVFDKDIENKSLYVALDGEKIAAIYVISGEADEAYDKVTWRDPKESAYIIHRFCVAPEYQNKGVGRIVLAHIEEQIAELGYKSVRLDVFIDNPYAQRLYIRNGYELRGFADWRKGRFSLMEKRLKNNN